jgi:hypothetical protein
MDIIRRLLKAIGVVSTPAAAEAVISEISLGEAAFILDALDSFESIFGRNMVRQIADAESRANVGSSLDELEKGLASFQRNMNLRGNLLWNSSDALECGEGLWSWSGADGAGEA